MKKFTKLLLVAIFAVLLAFAAAACGLGTGGTGDEKETGGGGPKAYKTAGTYKVGTDMDAGEYLLISDYQEDTTTMTAYYQVTLTANASVTSTDFLYNNNFYFRTYVKVEDGQYFNFTRSKLYKIEDCSAIDKNAASWRPGQYKIGADIDSGEYKFTVLEAYASIGGSVVVTKIPDVRPISTDFVSIKIVDSTHYVDLAEGQYVELARCSMAKA